MNVIQLIKFNKPGITGRIFTRDSFCNLNDEFLYIERPFINCECSDVLSLFHIIYKVKYFINDNGLFIHNFNLIDTKENDEFLQSLRINNQSKVGLCLKGNGSVRNREVKDYRIINILIIKDIKRSNVHFNPFEQELMLEFDTLDKIRYGKKY